MIEPGGTDKHFGDSFVDPFAPEVVRRQLPDGSDGVDMAATAYNYVRAPLPEICSDVFRPGDVLTAAFDIGDEEDHVETFDITTILPSGALYFGSESITERAVTMDRRGPDGETRAGVRLHGSSLRPDGRMHTPGMVKIGYYMLTSEGVSPGPLTSFDLERPDEGSQLRSVPLNKQETRSRSESYDHAISTFSTIEAALTEDGFSFDDHNERGQTNEYCKVQGNTLIYARRQGFGHGVIPQDEIYVYDAKAQILRAMRNMPTAGIFQSMVAEGVSKEQFARVFLGYKPGTNKPDWRHPLFVSLSGVSELSEDVPIVSYTWMHPGQEAPTISVMAAGEPIGEIFKTPKQKGSHHVEQLEAHGAGDLVEHIHETLGLDPSDTNPIYDELHLNLYPDGTMAAHSTNDALWETEDNLTAFTRRVEAAVTIDAGDDEMLLSIDGYTIRVRTDASNQIDRLARSARLALGRTAKNIGARMLSGLLQLRPGRIA